MMYGIWGRIVCISTLTRGLCAAVSPRNFRPLISFAVFGIKNGMPLIFSFAAISIVSLRPFQPPGRPLSSSRASLPFFPKIIIRRFSRIFRRRKAVQFPFLPKLSRSFCACDHLYLMKKDPKLLERRVYAGPTAEKETSQKII